MSNNRNNQEVDISPSIEALLLKSIDEERLRQNRKKYFRLAELIANSMHEICVHLCLIGSFLMMMHPTDQKKVASALKLDIDLCRDLDCFTKTAENLPIKIRNRAIKQVQRNMLKPFFKKYIEAIRIQK